MSSSDVPYSAVDSFRLWIQEGQGSCAHVKGKCLLDYIDAWLCDGPGVESCWGDFQIFLSAVAIIIDEWHREPDLLDYTGDPDEGEPDVVERRVESVFSDTQSYYKYRHRVFDPHHFTAARFNRLHQF